MTSKNQKQEGGLKRIISFLYQDNFKYGLILGLLAPVVGFLSYKTSVASPLTLKETFQWLKFNPHQITVFISVSLVANAVLFTIFINGHRDRTAKGIFVVTLIYAAIAMAFKFA
jgi:hypothetical protein